MCDRSLSEPSIVIQPTRILRRADGANSRCVSQQINSLPLRCTRAEPLRSCRVTVCVRFSSAICDCVALNTTNTVHRQVVCLYCRQASTTHSAWRLAPSVVVDTSTAHMVSAVPLAAWPSCELEQTVTPALFLQRSVAVVLAFVALLTISGVAWADQVGLPRETRRLPAFLCSSCQHVSVVSCSHLTAVLHHHTQLSPNTHTCRIRVASFFKSMTQLPQ